MNKVTAMVSVNSGTWKRWVHFISKETVEHTSNCEFLLKIYHNPPFVSRFHRQNLLQRSPLFTHQPHEIEVSFSADVSENILPFESQSINSFSGIDISQSADWECPYLSPHVLLKEFDSGRLSNTGFARTITKAFSCFIT